MRYNAKSQIKDTFSVLNYMKSLISLRKENQTLIYGDFILTDNDADTFCYERKDKDARFYIEINLIDSNKKRKTDVRDKKYRKILSNYPDSNEFLRPYEVAIYMIGEEK
ncbi:MAG: Oligo-1,6-glucosidase 1 [Firmicutes bacterium ADurb.Bin099]|nr:MAG: Oligo-1,6-glucosidase 1 [Firmicutes bacterium ADurb.Bin099]